MRPSTQGCGSGCSCGCGGRNYEVEDPWRGQVEFGDEQGCSCCGADNDEYVCTKITLSYDNLYNKTLS